METACQHAVAVPRAASGHFIKGQDPIPGAEEHQHTPQFAADPKSSALGRVMLASAVLSHTPVPAHPVLHHESQPAMSKQGWLKKSQV